MHAFFLTARPPCSELEQPRLRVLVGAVGFCVTPTTGAGRLLDLGLTLLEQIVIVAGPLDADREVRRWYAERGDYAYAHG
jgi:hypothetical protein